MSTTLALPESSSKPSSRSIDELVLNCAMRIDPVVFSEAMFGWYPDPVQSEVLRSDSQLIVCNCHRQWGKSTTIAIKALHCARHERDQLILITSPTETQSKELFRKILVFANRIPDLEKVEDSKSYMTLTNGSRIVSLCGKESSVRGYSSPNIVIIDEASRTLDELFVAVEPMILMGQGQEILISTPHGKQGAFFHIWEEGGDLWQRFRVTVPENPRVMDDPRRRRWYQNELETKSERYVRQEYLCEFVETEDSVWSYDLIAGALLPGDDIIPFHRPVDNVPPGAVKPFRFGG